VNNGPSAVPLRLFPAHAGMNVSPKGTPSILA
jgi:hypothetical protein